MKKTKFLSLLLFAPLLASCGGKVKVPKFAEYGKEVSGDKFIELVEKFQTDSALYKAAKLGSYEFDYSQQFLESAKETRGKEKLYEKTISSEDKGKGGYCKENLVIKSESNYKYSYKEVGNEGLVDGRERKQHNVTFIQSAKVGKKSYVVAAEKDAKAYMPVSEITKENPEVDLIDLSAKRTAQELTEPMTEILTTYAMTKSFGGDVSKYKFYQNDKILTCEWKTETTDKSQTDGKDWYTVKSEYRWTVQADITEGKWSIKAYESEDTNDETHLTAGGRVKGDVRVEKKEKAYEAKITSKKYGAKPINVSKFEALGFDAI